MKSTSILGCGVRFYDLDRELPDRIVATQWFSLLFIPIIPLRRARCRAGAMTAPIPDMDDRLTLIDCERVPLEIGGVIVTYVSAFAALLVTIGPIAFFIWLTDGRAAKPWEMSVLLGFIFLAAGLLIWQDVRVKRFIEESRSHDDRRTSDDAEQDRLETARTDWARKHVIPERAFLYAMIVGLVPGLAAGRWLGWWGGNLLFVLSLLSGGICAGLLWCVDRLLVRDRDRQNAQETDFE